jgi:hypothetical protein
MSSVPVTVVGFGADFLGLANKRVDVEDAEDAAAFEGLYGGI